MSPRTYKMDSRAKATAQTRARIVEATAKLHGERGVFGTSWQDIAAEADVSVATVYNHFPSLADLLPACGAHIMEMARPPEPDKTGELLAGANGPHERLRRVARELFAYYERGGPHLEVDARERQIPGMAEWEESERQNVSRFVRAALAGTAPGAALRKRVSALLDPPFYRAMRARGLSAMSAADTAADLAAGLLQNQNKETN